MIKFLNLKYKNFLSSGNYWTEINLNKTCSTLIVGHNGAGKSTILDALTFVLFNKPFRKINKNQLINSINEKDCQVEVNFIVGNDKYKIRRGMKPTVFEICKNNTVFDQMASSTDQQKWLEQNILKLNYKSFIQIVVLGSSNFVPFMQLSPQHRREVVEDLLDIKVFSSMNDVAKSKIKELKDEIKECGYKKENLFDKIESQKKLIQEIENRKTQDIKNKDLKLKSLDSDLSCLREEKRGLFTDIEACNNEISEISFSENLLKKFETISIKLDQKLSNLLEDYDFFSKSGVCPTCTQTIEEHIRLNKISSLKEKLEEIESGKSDLQSSIQKEQSKKVKIQEISKRLVNLTNELNLNDVKISEIEKQFKELESEIQKLRSNDQNANIEIGKLQSIENLLETVITEISDKKQELQNYEFITLLLKDDGAKSKIIKKYLPIINTNLNKYLEILEFPVHFMLDEEFNERALNPIYEDFSYSSFSEGEKMRIDLALLFTWREVAKFKNSINTNLLVLDEIFDSSLDESGTDYFTKIIKYVVKDSNTFVISHKVDDLFEKFDDVIKFEKRKGFSIMVDQ